MLIPKPEIPAKAAKTPTAATDRSFHTDADPATRMARPSAQVQRLQIIEADLNGFERRHIAAVLLDEDVFGAGLAGMGKDPLPIDAALADGHERVRAVVGRILRACFPYSPS